LIGESALPRGVADVGDHVPLEVVVSFAFAADDDPSASPAAS
jgi:hypothetical protein